MKAAALYHKKQISKLMNEQELALEEQRDLIIVLK